MEACKTFGREVGSVFDRAARTLAEGIVVTDSRSRIGSADAQPCCIGSTVVILRVAPLSQYNTASQAEHEYESRWKRSVRLRPRSGV
jgi:hypothetical protein